MLEDLVERGAAVPPAEREGETRASGRKCFEPQSLENSR